jgi:hypothetical protein
VILLEFGMQAAYSFIIQLHIVDLFATDRDGWLEIPKYMASLQSFQNSQSHESHAKTILKIRKRF